MTPKNTLDKLTMIYSFRRSELRPGQANSTNFPHGAARPSWCNAPSQLGSGSAEVPGIISSQRPSSTASATHASAAAEGSSASPAAASAAASFASAVASGVGAAMAGAGVRAPGGGDTESRARQPATIIENTTNRLNADSLSDDNPEPAQPPSEPPMASMGSSSTRLDEQSPSNESLSQSAALNVLLP